jgi:hypothetical protein
MSNHWANDFSLLFGTAVGPDRLLVAAVQDQAAEKKLNLTLLFHWFAGKWEVIDEVLLDAGVGLAVLDLAAPQCMFLGLNGRALRFRVLPTSLEFISNEDIRSRHGPPVLRALAAIDGAWFAAGMGREVYRCDPGGGWHALDDHIRISEPGIEPIGLQTLEGYSDSEIYAAGFGGEVWNLDNGRWHQEESPTNVALDTCCCCPDGLVRIAGKCGVILEGRRNSWRVVPQGTTDSEFFSSAWFKDRLYLASTDAVFRLMENELETVDFGATGPASCFHVTTDGHALWSIGPKDILCFDGRAWNRID